PTTPTCSRWARSPLKARPATWPVIRASSTPTSGRRDPRARREPMSLPRTAPADARTGTSVTRSGLDQSRLTHLVGYAATRASVELKKTFQKHLGPLDLRAV